MNPRDIQPGDVCQSNGTTVYTVLEVIEKSAFSVTARVQWSDGGIEPRTWSEPDVDIPTIIRLTNPE